MTPECDRKCPECDSPMSKGRVTLDRSQQPLHQEWHCNKCGHTELEWLKKDDDK